MTRDEAKALLAILESLDYALSDIADVPDSASDAIAKMRAEVLTLACASGAHEFVADHCGKAAHDFCSICGLFPAENGYEWRKTGPGEFRWPGEWVRTNGPAERFSTASGTWT